MRTITQDWRDDWPKRQQGGTVDYYRKKYHSLKGRTGNMRTKLRTSLGRNIPRLKKFGGTVLPYAVTAGILATTAQVVKKFDDKAHPTRQKRKQRSDKGRKRGRYNK